MQDHNGGKKNRAAGYTEKEKAMHTPCFLLSEVTFKQAAAFLQDCLIFAAVS